MLMMLYTWRESSSIQGISDGDNKTDVELPDGVSGEVKESTNANHQPSSSVVPGGGRLASTKPVDGLNENGEKARMAQLHFKKHSSPLNFLLLLCLPFIFLSDKALATLIYFLLNPIQRWMF